MKNFYEELNIAFNANEQTILNALQRLAQSGQYSLEEIQQIKETLLNPKKRAEYNLTLTQNKSKNFYEILNISPNASENIILNAIRRKAENGELSLEEIQEIKETLLNSDKRVEYNQTIVVEEKFRTISTKPKKFSPKMRVLIILITTLLLGLLARTIFFKHIDNQEQPYEVNIDDLYQKNYSYKPKEMIKISSSKISKGELLFFAKGDEFMNIPNVKPLSNDKNKPIATEYLAITKDNKGNFLVLYRKKPFRDRLEYPLEGYTSYEKHIQWLNINLPDAQNEKTKQAAERLSLTLNAHKTNYLTDIKLLDDGKLYVMETDETSIFYPDLYVSVLDNVSTDVVRRRGITRKMREPKTMFSGEAKFFNDRYLVFDTDNIHTTHRNYQGKDKKDKYKLTSQLCLNECMHGDYQGYIVFYDTENEKVSDIRIPYNVREHKISDEFDIYTWLHTDRKVFIDPNGKKIGIYFRLYHSDKKTNQERIDSFFEVYEMKKDKNNTIISANKILHQYFPDAYIEQPKFSDDGKEIYFIKSPPKKSSSVHSELSVTPRNKRSEFIRWSIDKNKAIQSSEIDVFSVVAHHFNPKRNEFFALGMPDDHALSMFNGKIKSPFGHVHVYYHNFKQKNGFIDELVSVEENLMSYPDYSNSECNFLFSENEDIFMPICRGFLKTPVYFHTKDMEKPVYLNDILKEKNIVY
ncbi:MAG: hypothetical protein IKH45_08185 [Neisseriaceae bacterium]|nr:hypothetical protein [Neisseriaceae bacterium]